MRRAAATLALLPLALGSRGQSEPRRGRNDWPLRLTMAESLGELDVQEALRLDLPQRLRLRSLRASPPQSQSRVSTFNFPRGFRGMVAILDGMEGSLRRDQIARLKQLSIRRLGHFAVLNSEISRTLGLSVIQRRELERISDLTRQAMLQASQNSPKPPAKGAGTQERSRFWLAQRAWSQDRLRQLIVIRRNALSTMMQRLTPDQRNRWLALAGRPYAERFLHPSASLEAEMWRRSGIQVGDNPALADAKLRMLSKMDRAAFRRACVRKAGIAALLFPEVCAEIGLSPEDSERVYATLWNVALNPGKARPGAESLLDAGQRRKWQALTAP